jgi:hypothetical protein
METDPLIAGKSTKCGTPTGICDEAYMLRSDDGHRRDVRATSLARTYMVG